MEYIIGILRKNRDSQERYVQEFSYSTDNYADTVATALNALNARGDLRDRTGAPARKIEWECSCLQKKCGACAMVIGGRPCLACGAYLADYPGGRIDLEPLRKFPVVCDLIVDRKILMENLLTMRVFPEGEAELRDEFRDLAYESSECIQCGLCLEVCPNFYTGGRFFGMSAVPLTTRLLTEMTEEELRDLRRMYAKHIFDGCGRSLACRDVCPRHIDTEKLLVNANAFAIWKRGLRKKRLQEEKQ